MKTKINDIGLTPGIATCGRKLCVTAAGIQPRLRADAVLHYLRRNPNNAPEAGLSFAGYNFWLTKLNQFDGNFINAEMVKAFISSTEYRQRFEH